VLKLKSALAIHLNEVYNEILRCQSLKS